MRLKHIESRLENQIALMELIANAVDNLTKIEESNITPNRVHARLTSLKEKWEQFSVQHKAIGLSISELSAVEKSILLNNPYFSENFYSMTHECYLEAVEKMSSFLEPEQEPILHTPSIRSNIRTSSGPAIRSDIQTSSIPTYFHHARLPRIDIPKFNGSPADWLSFKDLFSSIILMNPSLTSVEKLQYLKTSLIGSAAPLLKNTTLTSDNFQKAWDALIAFYENKRLLVNAALHSLVNLKRMTKESASEMEQLYTNIMQIYRTLETLQRPIHHWDDFLVFIAIQRLDAESVKAWEHHLGSAKEPPTWSQFSEFLVTRLLSLQAFEKARPGKFDSRSHRASAKSHFQGKSKDGKLGKFNPCMICSGKHYLANCQKYISKTVPQRQAFISKNKLCYNCLGQHRAALCRVTKRCYKCGNKHHTSIHQFDKQPVQSESTSIKSGTPAASTSTATGAKVLHFSTTKNAMPCVLLATAQILVMTENGDTTRAHALLDQGSEISLISERLVQRLWLPRKSSSIPLIGIGAQRSSKTRGITSFILKPHFKNKFECRISAHILPKLTASLPSVNSDVPSWNHLNGLLLADPDFLIPGSIDLILGADVYGQIIEDGIVKGGVDSPFAQRTNLGWIISGPSYSNPSSQDIQSYHVSMDKELYELIHRFWELEEISSTTAASLPVADQECELHFQSTHTRDSHGRYQVRLPFKESANKLDSRAKAVRIVTSLSKRLASDALYSKSYCDFMEEYEALHHMRLVSDSIPEPQQVYYLPHHGVLRESNFTTKIRVVFNGSSPTSTGCSLNDLLHTGAKLQIDLFDILIWFRQFRYVFSSDMEKMYRQINVHPDDWDYQRILWINKFNQLRVYRLTTVTYGLACAPFLALRTLSQLVEDEGKKFPLAVPVLKKGRNVFGGADSVQQTQEIVQQVNNLCMAGGFPLHKWVTNHPEVLMNIPPEKRVNPTTVRLDENKTIHALGLCWDPNTDTFLFTMKLPPTNAVTKRILLSVIARIFDPLGFLSPVIITAKILIQELWSLKLDWDDPLPMPVSQKWANYVGQLEKNAQPYVPSMDRLQILSSTGNP